MIFFLVLPLAALFCFVFHTEVETYLCSVLFLNALPVPLLRQVFFYALEAYLSRLLLMLPWEGPRRVFFGPLAPFRAHLGVILSHFGCLLGVGGLCEN